MNDPGPDVRIGEIAERVGAAGTRHGIALLHELLSDLGLRADLLVLVRPVPDAQTMTIAITQGEGQPQTKEMLEEAYAAVLNPDASTQVGDLVIEPSERSNGN